MAARLAISGGQCPPIGRSEQETSPAVGHNLASRTGDQDRKWDGEVHASHNLGFLARSAGLAFSGWSQSPLRSFSPTTAPMRAATGIVIIAATTRGSAESYSPAFSSIIVDGNSGATLSANNPDGHPPSGLAHQDHDALSAVRASRCRQDEARHRNAGVRARLRPGSHQTRPAPRPDHSRRRRHQGTGDALRQRRRRRDRGSHRRRRRRFRQDDDPQGARARHDQDGLSQRLRPARRRTGHDRARSGDARPRHPGPLSALLPLFLDHGVQLPRPDRSATTITCSAASKASTASRPATPAPPASTS